MPGIDGKNGKDGRDGAIGPIGLQGPIGIQGPRGTNHSSENFAHAWIRFCWFSFEKAMPPHSPHVYLNFKASENLLNSTICDYRKKIFIQNPFHIVL